MNPFYVNNKSEISYIGSYLGRDSKTKYDIFVIIDGISFLEKNPIKAIQLSMAFEFVQDSVWNKMNNTLDSSLKVGLVYYFEVSGQIVGFLSAKYQTFGHEEAMIYFSDAMILKEHQGNGLCSVGFTGIFGVLTENMKIKPVYASFISGHIATFSFFLNSGVFTKVNLNSIKVENKNHFLNFFNELGVSSEIQTFDVIKSIWKKQNSTDDHTWPAYQAQSLGLDSNVNYNKGDAVMAVFKYTSNLQWFLNYFNKFNIQRDLNDEKAY